MSGTGLVAHPVFLEHRPAPGHPESPERLAAVYGVLRQNGLLQEAAAVPLRGATEGELLRFHCPAYLDQLRCSEPSYAISLLAVGSLLNATDAVLAGELENAFGLVRPPGHHAESDRQAGYCQLNNVALTVHHALAAHGLERVLVVDWDVHHGNGIQNAFYDDPRVLYFSIHRQGVFPNTGATQEVGHGPGAGFNINVNLPTHGFGNNMYDSLFARLLRPIALAFRPQLVVVAAGFDSYFLDDVGLMRVTADGFAKLTYRLVELARRCCDRRLLLCLEGGYHSRGLARCVSHVVEVLMGRRQPITGPLKEPPELAAILAQQERALRPFWPDLADHTGPPRSRSPFWHGGQLALDDLALRVEHRPMCEDDWVTATLDGTAVCRAKIARRGRQLVVKFITVGAEYERNGIARWVVSELQGDADEVIAQGVRYTARGFWQRLGFARTDEGKDYRWVRPPTP